MWISGEEHSGKGAASAEALRNNTEVSRAVAEGGSGREVEGRSGRTLQSAFRTGF